MIIENILIKIEGHYKNAYISGHRKSEQKESHANDKSESELLLFRVYTVGELLGERIEHALGQTQH